MPHSLVNVDGHTYQVSLEQGQVWVHLPFAVDPHELSVQLQREGYALAHEPDTPDTQGWGETFDPNGYYPYCVFPDPTAPGRSVFAFYPRPEDVVRQGPDGEAVALSLGRESERTIARWVPWLRRRVAVRKPDQGVNVSSSPE